MDCNIYLFSHTHPFAQQDHSRLTGILRDAAMRLQNAEALLTLDAEQHESNQEKNIQHNSKKSQYIILIESALDGERMPSSPLPSIQLFLNARNDTILQAGCDLMYSRKNLYLTTSLCKVLLQVHILVMLYPYTPTDLSPISIYPALDGHDNKQKCVSTLRKRQQQATIHSIRHKYSV